MTDRQQTPETENKTQQRLSDRRQLLKMGAAGLPMVLTLKASAQQVVVSQLQCAFVLSSRVRILVDCDGTAWVGSSNITYWNGYGWYVPHVTYFKDNADYVFPAGTVPNSYRPSSCPFEPCDDDSGGKGKGNSGDYDNDGISELDALLNAPMPANAADFGNFNSRSRKDDDSCDPNWQDGGYAFYTLNSNTEIKPVNYLNGASWNPTGTRGLYLLLSMSYANSYGKSGTWPGVSCVASILSYLGQL